MWQIRNYDVEGIMEGNGRLPITESPRSLKLSIADV